MWKMGRGGKWSGEEDDRIWSAKELGPNRLVEEGESRVKGTVVKRGKRFGNWEGRRAMLA